MVTPAEGLRPLFQRDGSGQILLSHTAKGQNSSLTYAYIDYPAMGGPIRTRVFHPELLLRDFQGLREHIFIEQACF